MDSTTTRSLSLLLKHYSALSPTVPSLLPIPSRFPSSKTLSLATTQQWLVENLLPLDQDQDLNQVGQRNGSGSMWKKSFWKRVVKGIEQGFEERRIEEGEESVQDEEVEEEILERMVEYLASSTSGGEMNSGLNERIYYWGDLELPRNEWKSVRTREEGRMISGGTTGLRTWQACIALSNHFLVDPTPIYAAKNIVELGAGVGLLSLVSATLKRERGNEQEQEQGAGKIISTDVEEKVLELLDSNVRLNGLENFVKTLKLDWELALNLDLHEEELRRWEKEVYDLEDERADLIIGADIVYDPSLTAPLAATISWFLQARTDDVVVVEPQAIIAGTIRNETTWELFLTECRSREMRIEDLELKKLEDGNGLVGAEGWEGEGFVKVVRISRAVV